MVTATAPMVDPAVRAKPLNATTLAALPVGVATWDEEIAYLNDAIERNDARLLVEKFTAKRDALIRARNWLQSKIDAESASREHRT